MAVLVSRAERCRIQHEHPHARSSSQLLSGYAVAGPEGRRAAGEAHFRARCHLLTDGHEGEPLAAHSDRCQQEEGRREPPHVCRSAGICDNEDLDEVTGL